MKIKDTTLILDSYFSEDVTINYWYSWFVGYYLIPFIRDVYMQEIRYDGFATRYIMEINSIKVLGYLGNDTFYDITRKTFVSEFDYMSYSDFVQDNVSNSDIYAIGTSKNGEERATDFLNVVERMNKELNQEINVYVYNPAGYNFFVDNLTIYYTGGIDNNHLLDIIVDFVKDEDLSKYDNWSGVCVVTHKLITFGSSGWMIDVYGSGFDYFWSGGFECWQIYMTEEEEDYFIGDDDYKSWGWLDCCVTPWMAVNEPERRENETYKQICDNIKEMFINKSSMLSAAR